MTNETNQDVAIYEILDNGFYIAQFLSAGALHKEFETMNTSYDGWFNDSNHPYSDTLYLSLRDESNTPKAIFIIFNQNVVELIVPNHQLPSQSDLNILGNYFHENLITANKVAKKCNNIIDRDGKWHHINNLPSGLQIDGDLDLIGMVNITKLPDSLRVSGNLNISHTKPV